MEIADKQLEEKFVAELHQCTFSISYTPFAHELDPDSIPCLRAEIPVLRVSQKRELSPIDFAKKITSTYPNEHACLLIPGMRFDWYGTRHGHGGGWYDRLLAHLPKHYLRIGIAKREQISHIPLIRNPWDEPMDWLVYPENGGWSVKQTPRS